MSAASQAFGSALWLFRHPGSTLQSEFILNALLQWWQAFYLGLVRKQFQPELRLNQFRLK